MSRFLRGSFLILSVALVGGGLLRGAGSGRPSRHVILVSIGGLLASDLPAHDSDVFTSLPVLGALVRGGVRAGGVLGTYPTLTYPAHATLATGVRPKRHGVFQDTFFDPTDRNGRWRFGADALRAPALWDRASEAGLTTAAVCWPLTLGAHMDALVPAVAQDPEGESWLDLERRSSTPGLVDDVVALGGGLGPRGTIDMAGRDRFAALAASHIVQTLRPSLLLVHFGEIEAARHLEGRRGPLVEGALERVDTHVGRIVAATRSAGLLESTTFLVTGDHGFREAHTALQPNVALRQAGLLETDGDGRIVSWKAAAHRAAIRLADPTDRETANRARRAFHDLATALHPGLFRLVERAELDDLGADPDALFYLEPAEGYTVNERLDGDTFLAPAPVPGHHGFLPDSAGMLTGLVLSGAGVGQGTLPLVRQIDLAPTVARLLGFDMPETDGAPLVAAFSEAQNPGRTAP